MNDIAYGFSPRDYEEKEYLEEDAKRALGYKLLEKLEPGDRFTVKMIKRNHPFLDGHSLEDIPKEFHYNYNYNPTNYGSEPLYTWELELGKAYERHVEIPVFNEDIVYIGKSLPKYEIEQTAFLPMFLEVSKRIFNFPGDMLKLSAEKVDRDIKGMR